MNKNKRLPYTWIEVTVVICALLIIARFYWAKELYELEQSFFASNGIDGNLITIPLAFLYCFVIYQREKKKYNGKPVVSRWVIIFAATSIFAVILYLAIWV